MPRYPLNLLILKLMEKPTPEDLAELRRELSQIVDNSCSQGPRPTRALSEKRVCRKALEMAEEIAESVASIAGGERGRDKALSPTLPSWWETRGEEPLVALRITRSFSLDERDFHPNTIVVVRASLARKLLDMGLAEPLDSALARKEMWKRY